MELYKKHTKAMLKLCELHGLQPEEIKDRHIICKEIVKSLKPFYPHCEMYIYGSTLNSFGTKNSDLDLLFVPYPEFKSENCDRVKVKNKDINCPSINDVKTEKVSKEALLQMDVCPQLNFIRKVLRRYRIQKPVVIAARCPILNFYLPHLNTNCDISYGSRLVLYNTKLLHFYSTIDSCVRPLVMTLRHWAKCLTFILPGILSSYSFTLLVIFFLQSTNPPILPSVKELILLSGSSKCIENCEVGFTTDLSKLKVSKNEKSPGELLKNFFIFYWKFDFTTKIVCPYLGKDLHIKEMLESDDENLKDFEITPMCIQDPLLLSCNVGRNVKPKVFYAFKRALLAAIEILDDERNSFQLLFNEYEYKKRNNQIFYPPFSETEFSFYINLIYRDCTLLLQQTNWKDIWYESVCQSVLDLLRYGLLIECEVIEKSKDSDKNSLEKQDIGNSHNLELLMSIQCAVYHRTYVGRSHVKEIPPVDCDSEQFHNKVIKEEYIISNYLIQQNVLLSSPEPYFWFYCDCYAHKFDELVSTLVVLHPLTQSKEFKSVSNFLSSFIPQRVTKMMSENANPSDFPKVC